MKIITKHDIGSTVYFHPFGKPNLSPVEGKVIAVSATVTGKHLKIEYTVEVKDSSINPWSVPEKSLVQPPKLAVRFPS